MSDKYYITRLYLVSREFNVSIDAIVAYLEVNNQIIKYDPLAQITETQYKILKDKFSINEPPQETIPINIENASEATEIIITQPIIPNSDEILTGEVMFYNGVYGFIFTDDNNSYFFHKKQSLVPAYKPKLFDIVTFKVKISSFWRQRGKSISYDVALKSKGDLSKHIKYAGILKDFDFGKGIIESNQMPKPTIFYNTRLIPIGDTVKNDDLLIFFPVKSYQNPDDLFALFAYHLKNERDMVFLQKLYAESQIPEIKEYINTTINNKNDKTILEKFIFDLQAIVAIQSNIEYEKLVKKIQHYKNEHNFLPSFQILKNYIPYQYLIQLWENNIIKEYELNIIKN